MFKQKTILSIFVLLAFSFVSVAIQAQLDDPTRPPGYRLVLPGGKKASAGVIRYTLSSVKISSSRRSAVINDRSVEAGDHVNGAKVVAIYPSTVKLKKQGEIFTVRLLSRISKKIRTR